VGARPRDGAPRRARLRRRRRRRRRVGALQRTLRPRAALPAHGRESAHAARGRSAARARRPRHVSGERGPPAVGPVRRCDNRARHRATRDRRVRAHARRRRRAGARAHRGARDGGPPAGGLGLLLAPGGDDARRGLVGHAGAPRARARAGGSARAQRRRRHDHQRQRRLRPRGRPRGRAGAAAAPSLVPRDVLLHSLRCCLPLLPPRPRSSARRTTRPSRCAGAT
jgi:hypothetical protein